MIPDTLSQMTWGSKPQLAHGKLLLYVQEERKWRVLSSAETTGKFSSVGADKTDLTYSVFDY